MRKIGPSNTDTHTLTYAPSPRARIHTHTRVQVFKVESFAYNASSDVIQAEQMADAQLKTVVQEWESMLDGLKARVEYRVSEELNSTVYPQVCVCIFLGGTAAAGFVYSLRVVTHG